MRGSSHYVSMSLATMAPATCGSDSSRAGGFLQRVLLPFVALEDVVTSTTRGLLQAELCW